MIVNLTKELASFGGLQDYHLQHYSSKDVAGKKYVF